jgi:putative glycosyltransferase (TIGR04372 family)
MTQIGYKAIRMGSKVHEALQTSNPSIVDYASNDMRTELLDLYLVSLCKFFVTTGTGLEAVAQVFRRPLVFVNFPQFGHMDLMENTALFLPKHFWSIQEKRMLTFPEIFQSGAHVFTLQAQYQRANIESVDNTPEEIVAIVSEMEQRLSGTWVGCTEDEALQDRLRAIWPHRSSGGPLMARMGMQFLRQHPELLG